MQSETTCQTLARQVANPSAQERQDHPERMDALVGDPKRERRRRLHREWVRKNKNHRLAYMKRWYCKNKERMSEKFRQWTKNNWAHRKSYKKSWAKANPESARKTYLKWYKNNREYVLEKSREYHHKNKDRDRLKRKLYHQKYYRINRDSILAKTKQYAQSHPNIRRKAAINYRDRHPDKYKAQVSAMHSRRKAAMRGADVGCRVVGALIKRWKLKPYFVCYWCERRFPIDKMHVDHIVPVTRGGNHEASNVCKSCGPCNIRRRNYLPRDSRYRGQIPLL